MYNIESFAFNKTLIFIVDSNDLFINMNSELCMILNLHHIDKYIGLTFSQLESRLPYYMKELFSNSSSCVPLESIDFNNGYLSFFHYDFIIDERAYKYMMATFTQKDISKPNVNDSLIIDGFSDVYAKNILETLTYKDGSILLIKLKGLAYYSEKENRLIESFSKLITDCFLDDDIVFRVNHDTFSVFRATKRNNYHGNILTLKKMTVRFFGKMYPDLWFSYVFEPIRFGDVYKSILNAKARLLSDNNYFQ